MSRGIPVSPKHGLNPSIVKCIYCGESLGIALCGKLDREDSEAPREIHQSPYPCEKCEKTLTEKNEVRFLEVISEIDQTPTGRYVDIPFSNLQGVKKYTPVALADVESFNEWFGELYKK